MERTKRGLFDSDPTEDVSVAVVLMDNVLARRRDLRARHLEQRLELQNNQQFSTENRQFLGAIPHYLCIFSRKFKKNGICVEICSTASASASSTRDNAAWKIHHLNTKSSSLMHNSSFLVQNFLFLNTKFIISTHQRDRPRITLHRQRRIPREVLSFLSSPSGSSAPITINLSETYVKFETSLELKSGVRWRVLACKLPLGGSGSNRIYFGPAAEAHHHVQGHRQEYQEVVHVPELTNSSF